MIIRGVVDAMNPEMKMCKMYIRHLVCSEAAINHGWFLTGDRQAAQMG